MKVLGTPATSPSLCNHRITLLIYNHDK